MKSEELKEVVKCSGKAQPSSPTPSSVHRTDKIIYYSGFSVNKPQIKVDLRSRRARADRLLEGHSGDFGLAAQNLGHRT